ncbi:MAG: LacI family DNA-binding transcriptional regulator [Candidatus Marinimicrobia bacterium]|nr:LacI family DNA-binding transcriptional regulator [Candidatus Neomarinimicrobiota bacterium]
MATIIDVAKLAGVSTATVSRVINDTGKVRPVTRKKVMKVVNELNFSPNVSAQVLQSKQSKTIGMVFPDASSLYFSEIIRGICNYVNQFSFQIIIGSAHDEEEEVKTVSRFLNGHTVGGLVIMAPSSQNDDLFKLPINHGTPVVFISVPPVKAGTTSVVLDNFKMSVEMTNHLIRLGHRNIGFINGSPHNYDSQRRYAGYLKALQENGIEVISDFTIDGNFTEDSGYKTCLKLCELTSRPTAIFAANDAMAIGAIEAVKDSGLRVPEDIAIVGFDDISTSQYITPALTTVRVPLFNLGQVVGKTLLQKIDTNYENHIAVTERIVIPLKIIIRESCGSQLKR